MTKKDFELIAAALKRARNSVPNTSEFAVYEFLGNTQAAIALANDLATTNPRFDRAKFLSACGVAP